MNLRKAAILGALIVFSWVNILLLVGLAVSFAESPSIIRAAGVFIGFGMTLPIKKIYHDLDQVETEIRKFLQKNRTQIAVTVPLFVLTGLSFTAGYSIPLSRVLNLSFHASSQIFFPVKLFYLDFLGEKASSLLFNYGRWYLQFLWIYLIVGLLTDGYRKIRGSVSPSRNSIDASIIPFTGKSGAGTTAEVYVVTGMHGIIKIPEDFCKECHLFIRAVQEASREIDGEVDIQVKSYWTRFLQPLIRGGFHPPVLLLNGELVAQGYDVPGKEELVEKFESLEK